MKQQKPILHARDHLPGGADPLPDQVFETPGTVPPPDEAIQDEIDQGAAEGLASHWWRFREPTYEIIDAGTYEGRSTPDLGTYTQDTPGDMHISHWALTGLETTGGHPGPTAGSIAAYRECIGMDDELGNPSNIWNFGSGDVDDISAEQGKQFTVVGWFKFVRLPAASRTLGYTVWENFNTSGPTSDRVRLRSDGSLGVTRGDFSGSDPDGSATAPGLITPGVWYYIAYVVGLNRVKLYLNPTATETTTPDPAIGTSFPLAMPMAMETWGLENLDYPASELATRLTGNGFKSVAVQLNGTPRAGRTHADYIAQLTADVATLQAAGLQVVGWGVVDGTTAADLAATSVTGWLPQVEGAGERDAVISALGAGVGAGLSKAVVSNYGGLDTAADVAALKAAGIDAVAAEVYAADGHPDVTRILAAGQSYGFELAKMMPMLGTYRGEGPGDYRGFDQTVAPHYGIYSTAQTSVAQLEAFGSWNGDIVQWTAPVLDIPDTGLPDVGGPGGMDMYIGAASGPVDETNGSMEGWFTEFAVFEWMLPGDKVRDQYLSGAYGGTSGGTVPPNEEIPAGGITPGQIAPGQSGQVLGSDGTTSQWVANELDALTDVDTAGAADGDVLTYSSTRAVGTWHPAPVTGGGGADLDYSGDYAGATAYQDGDIVVHDGISYMAVRPTSVPPVPWPGGGGGGGGGGGLDYHGVWDAGTAYVDGDIVVYNDQLYLCVSPVTGVPPTGWGV